jgi:hypothetical protein
MCDILLICHFVWPISRSHGKSSTESKSRIKFIRPHCTTGIANYKYQIKAYMKSLGYWTTITWPDVLLTVGQVADSQCAGSVVSDASTYIVDWITRPSARLSPSTDATFESHNGSYILPPICEGINGHVDLELTGILVFMCHETSVSWRFHRSPSLPNYVQYRAG